MQTSTKSKHISVSLDAICDLINHFPSPACLINCNQMISANRFYYESMEGVDFRMLSEGAEAVKFKEMMINNALYLAHRVQLNNDHLLVTITEQKDVKLSTDPLTGLFNRECFDSIFEGMLENSKLKNEIMSVLFIDLDGFKAVNDTYGHEKGDVVLKTVAERLPKIVRANDICFRFGGDEFVVLLRDVKDRLHPCLVARRLIHSVSQVISLDESASAKVGASIGIASFPFDGKDMEELLKNADEAMYRAKKLGKNNYQLFGQ